MGLDLNRLPGVREGAGTLVRQGTQITEVVLEDGNAYDVRFWTVSPLWSTVEINGLSGADLIAFNYKEGDPVPGSGGLPGALQTRRSTRKDTNLQSVTLDKMQFVRIYGVHVELFLVGSPDPGLPNDAPNTTLEQVLRLQRSVINQVRVSTETKVRMPLGYFPAAMGVLPVFGAARDIAGTASVVAASNGGTDFADTRRFNTPYDVREGESMKFLFTFPEATSGAGGVPGLGLTGTQRIRARVQFLNLRSNSLA